jgi:hypothetical protein
VASSKHRRFVDRVGRERQRSAGDEPEVELEVAAKDMRRQQRDEHAPRGASRRDHQIEGRQMGRVGLQAHQLAVAHHAADEVSGAVAGDLDGDRGEDARSAHTPARRRGQHAEADARIPAPAREDEDEREEIETQGDDPEEGDDGHVDADLVRGRKQHDASASRQKEPEQASRGVGATASRGSMVSRTVGAVAVPLRHTSAALASEKAANTPKPSDQKRACSMRVRFGSTRTGYDTSARSDPKFESA